MQCIIYAFLPSVDVAEQSVFSAPGVFDTTGGSQMSETPLGSLGIMFILAFAILQHFSCSFARVFPGIASPSATPAAESPFADDDESMSEPLETVTPEDEEGEILEACDHAPEEPAEAELVDFPGITLNFSLLFSSCTLTHLRPSVHCFARLDTCH